MYYDGDCALCTRLVWGLSRTDFFRWITWTPYRTLQKPPQGRTWADLDGAAILDTGRGRVYEGFYAFRMLTLRLVPLLPLAFILWLPGVHLAGAMVYRWIARNRYCFSSCQVRDVGVDR